MVESLTSKRMTDRELLRSCMEAMYIAHRVQGARTDWSLMIEDIRRHLESSAHETNGVTDEQAFTAAAVRALRGHRWCGDQYPENGWPDINTALALYAKLGRSPLEPSPEPCKHGHTNQGCRECFPLKASETPQHDFRGPTVSCRCGWIGHPNALIGLTCPKCSAEFK